MKKIIYSFMGIALLLSYPVTVTARNPITLVKGDPMIILQKGKKAVYEIDYSKLIVTDTKHPENDVDYITWMKTQDEDDDQWIKDWEEKDKVDCDKAFRDDFNDEVDNGFKLTKYGNDYKVILRLNKIDFGPPVKFTLLGMAKGEADAWGEFEVRDFNTNETLLVLSFEKLRGEGSFKQIGRLKGIFENFGENLADYLKDYQKSLKKKKKDTR